MLSNFFQIPFLNYLVAYRSAAEKTEAEAEKELSAEAKKLYLHVFLISFLAAAILFTLKEN